VKAAREAWFEGQLDLDPTRIVFIDETAANTKMARLYGRAARGERCRAPVPHGHWKTTTFTAGLRHDRIAAPMVLDGPMNGEAFLAYVEQALVPELRPRDIVIMDNLPPTRSMASDRQSKPPARACDTCRPTALQSHRNGLRQAQSPLARRGRPYNPRPLASQPTPFAASPRKNAPTISPPLHTMQHERTMLKSASLRRRSAFSPRRSSSNVRPRARASDRVRPSSVVAAPICLRSNEHLSLSN
jgi:hypothetical protein